MNKTLHNSWLEIDMAKLHKNVRFLLDGLAPGVEMIPVLKDDAYGLGIAPIGRALAGYSAIQTMAVAHVSEGLALHEAGVRQEVLVMGGAPSHLIAPALESGLTLAAGRPGFIMAVAREAERLGLPARVEIKLETGLHRLGVKPGEELAALLGELEQAGGRVSVAGAFSHFAAVEDAGRTGAQYEAFLRGAAQIEEAGIALPRRHISGSAASEYCPEYALDAVRIGRRLYMDHPTRPLGGIEEVASWRSWVTNLRALPAGERLGYGAGLLLERDTTVATVGVGYGDGLNQTLATERAPVLVNGQQAHLLACCMDQCFLDVTGLDCAVDDEVTFFGYDGAGGFLSSQAVALLAGGDEGCGLTSALSPRVARVYK